MCNVSVDWNALSAVATAAAVIVAFISLWQNKKNMMINIKIQRLDMRLEKYLKIIVPYFETLRFVEMIKDKCDNYANSLAPVQKQIKKSVYKLLSCQLVKSIPEDEYLASYLLAIFGKDIVKLINQIDCKLIELDSLTLDKTLIDVLDIDKIKNVATELLAIRNQLGQELGKLFDVEPEIFKEYMLCDTHAA